MKKQAFDYIDSDSKLSVFCERIAAAPWVAVDTEFMRERTFYAELSLVQIASPLGNALIDPLAIKKLDPLAELMTLASCEKIFHSPDQDLEVLKQSLGVYPHPIFDTQLASSLLGQGDQIGYAALVKQLLNVELSKGQTRTNWHQRPLTPAQLQYAELDVIYLHPMLKILKPQLEDKGRLQWMADEIAAMMDKQDRAALAENAWQRLKGGARLSPEAQQVAKALAIWKEDRAQKRNLPREWVIKKNILLALANQKPRTMGDLKNVPDLNDKAIRGIGAVLLKVISGALSDDAQRVWEDVGPLNGEQKKRLKAMSAAVKTLAEAESILPALIINRAAIERIIRGQAVEQVLSGWRLELLSELIAEL